MIPPGSSVNRASLIFLAGHPWAGDEAGHACPDCPPGSPFRCHRLAHAEPGANSPRQTDQSRADEQPELETQIRAMAQSLAIALAEEGFAIQAANRDEQWEAPYEEAERIVRKLGLASLVTDERARLREYMRHTRDVHGYPCPEAITPPEWFSGVRCICGLDQPRRNLDAIAKTRAGA